MFRCMFLQMIGMKRAEACGDGRALAGLEPLEPRLLLSGAGVDGASGLASLDGGAAVQSMNLRPAAFIENQGQWADPDLFYLWNARGAAIAHTATGPVIQLRKAVVPETNPATAPTTPGALFSSTGSPLNASSTGQTVDQTHLTTGTSTLPNLELVPELAIDQPLDLATIPDPFGRDAAPLNFEIHNVSMRFEGANAVRPRGLELAQGYHNFYIGDPSLHRANVPGFTSVIYENLYEGIDLVMLAVAGGGDHLKYEFHLAPGADPGQIRIAWEGLEDLKLTPAADGLQMQTPAGTLTDSGLYVYQTGETGEEPIAAMFGLDEAGRVSFQITGEYDAGRGLVIDPVVAWGTYLGGNGHDSSASVTTDSFGNIYAVGNTGSAGWISGGYDTTIISGSDAFVIKLTSDGDHLWSTYAGDNGDDNAFGVTVDGTNNVIFTGYTSSSLWVVGGFNTTPGSGGDGFVAKLNPAGDYLWASYIGSTYYDSSYGVDVDSFDNIFITGETSSPSWAHGGFDPTFNGSSTSISDTFVIKAGPAGNHLWSTYLGGGNADKGFGISVDEAGDVLVVGRTASQGWATGGYDLVFDGQESAFLAKLDGEGNHLWSTYIGGGVSDIAKGVAVDRMNNVYVTGQTANGAFASGGYDTSYNGGFDGFLAKISPEGFFVWATYIGGEMGDEGHGIALDTDGNIFVAGETDSFDWTMNGHDTSYNGQRDAFALKIGSNGDHIWSTHIGGANIDYGFGITSDISGRVLIVGQTSSANWATAGFDIIHGGSSDGFLVSIADIPVAPPLHGDFNRDKIVDTVDIDLIHGRLRTGPYSILYDLNTDAQITRLDADFLIRDILDTEYGDADLNGLVSIGDLVVLATHYNLLEFGASWAQGDFNGNGAVTLGDLTILAEHFGFERGPAALAGEADPQPALLWGLQALGAAPAAADEEPEEQNALADILAELAAGDPLCPDGAK